MDNTTKCIDCLYADDLVCQRALASHPLPEFPRIVDDAVVYSENVQKFIEAWKESFGEDISPSDAKMRLDQLVFFFGHLAEIAAKQGISENLPE